MNDHIEEFVDSIGGADGTVESRRVTLRVFNDWLDSRSPTELGWVQLEDYFDHIEHEYAPSTFRIHFTSVKLLYDRLRKRDVIERTPFEELEQSKWVDRDSTAKERALNQKYPHISPEEKERVCDNVPAPTLRNELLVRLMYQTGVRVGEVESIDVDDVDRDRREIDIWGEKVSQPRPVYYQPSLDPLLDRYIYGGVRASFLTAPDSDRLFVPNTHNQSRNGESDTEPYLSQYRINDIVKEAAENAGVQDVMYRDAAGKPRYRVTAHALRHSFAVQSVRNDMDVARLSELMGHDSIETTKIYLQFDNDDLREAVQKYGAGSQHTPN